MQVFSLHCPFRRAPLDGGVHEHLPDAGEGEAPARPAEVPQGAVPPAPAAHAILRSLKAGDIAYERQNWRQNTV